MVRSGLDCFLREFPAALADKRLGIVCHAASVTASLVHITEAVAADSRATIGAIFGPQHGLFGQTQDNMVEWEGASSDGAGTPVYSLYGQTESLHRRCWLPSTRWCSTSRMSVPGPIPTCGR